MARIDAMINASLKGGGVTIRDLTYRVNGLINVSDKFTREQVLRILAFYRTADWSKHPNGADQIWLLLLISIMGYQSEEIRDNLMAEIDSKVRFLISKIIDTLTETGSSHEAYLLTNIHNFSSVPLEEIFVEFRKLLSRSNSDTLVSTVIDFITVFAVSKESPSDRDAGLKLALLLYSTIEGEKTQSDQALSEMKERFNLSD